MLEILLYLLIIGACGGIGILKAYGYRERVTLLEEFIKMTRTLKAELAYRLDPLPELLGRIGGFENDSAHLVCATAASIYGECRGESVAVAWEAAVKQVYRGTTLQPDDLRVMTEVGTDLGITSSESQNAFLTVQIAELTERLQDARQESATRGKMVTAMGFVLGITIVILMI